MSIICGPIVRHANRKTVNVWLVIDKLYKAIELQLYSDAEGNKQVSKDPAHRKVKLGTACYAVLVSANLQSTIDCDRVYYDILIDDQGFRESGLNTAICFPGEELPSLMIPKKHKVFLQASCRKPHDLEGIDQLGYAAELLRTNLNKSKRPSQLFLTGDQIYADDVSPILLHSFRGVSKALGIKKEMAAKEGGETFDPEKVRLDNRFKYLKKKKYGFTSGDMDSHLITFSEYLCMYLFCFSGMLPGQIFSEYEALQSNLRSTRAGDIGDEIDVYHYGPRNYKNDKNALDNFVDTANSRVRKALANISVYMIFDDHEVTDDWNLTKKNSVNLATSPIGRQIQVNALSTYLLCQHWGNQPGRIEVDLLERVGKMALSPTNANRQPLEVLWEKYWGYTLEQKPPVTVLDTRTQRVFSGDELALMSPATLFKLGKKLEAQKKTPTLIVVSPTPVFGFTEVEVIQLRGTSKLKTFVDREPWIANEFALQTLNIILTQTPGVKDIVIFSGDVHYAFSRRQILEDTGVTMWQLCSSAACNSPAGDNKALNFLKMLVDVFKKERTPYLVPRWGEKNIITSDKNIGSLELNEQLKPIKATLHCCNPGGKQYKKVYDLLYPKSYAGPSPKTTGIDSMNEL